MKTWSGMTVAVLLASAAPAVAGATQLRNVAERAEPSTELATPSRHASAAQARKDRDEERAAEQRTSMWIQEEWQAANR